jgi:hypothetical protein
MLTRKDWQDHVKKTLQVKTTESRLVKTKEDPGNKTGFMCTLKMITLSTLSVK